DSVTRGSAARIVCRVSCMASVSGCAFSANHASTSGFWFFIGLPRRAREGCENPSLNSGQALLDVVELLERLVADEHRAAPAALVIDRHREADGIGDGPFRGAD